MKLRIGGLAAFCALVSCMAMLLAPLARAEWLPPVEISETAEHAGQPHVALDSEGNATAVWDRWDGTATVVEAAYRPAGSPWGAPEAISPPDSWGAKVVVDRNGVLTATWQRWAGTNHFAIESASRLPGHEWAEPVEITEFEQGFHPEPWLAVDWEGNTTVVWTQGETIMSSFRTFALGWGEPVPLSPGESFTPQAAMDGRGDATAVWMHHDGSGYVVESAYRPEQGEWGEPTLVSAPGEEGGNPHVAIDGKGDSLVVWRGEDEGEEFARASYRPVGGSWSEPVNVSTEGEQVQSLRAALDPEGNAIVAWSGSFGKEGEYEAVHTAYKPAGEAWEEPVALSEEGANGYVNDVVFDQGGNAGILWIRWDGVTWEIHGAYRPKGEEWEEPVRLSEEGRDGMDPTLVLDAPGSATAADGDATAIWISTDPAPCPGGEELEPCSSYVVQAAGYDPDGLPEVEVEAPEEGTVGEEIEVSTPTEGLYSPSIEFGDGAKVAGTEATHIYEEPGTYLVKAAGAEELGYRGVAEHTITIRGDGEEEPDPDPGPDPGSGGESPQGGTKVEGPPLASPPPVPPGPSRACSAATAARDAAAARLRRARVRLESAGSPKAQRRLAAAMRERQAALRRARTRVAAAC
ncbi:MAG TPA: hypothetical protein VF125_01370 [Solirubrobacterales bacterium]